jgi:serine/threonine protein kinase
MAAPPPPPHRPLLSPAEGSALYDTLFDAGESLGSGAFGAVRAAVRRTDGAPVALKLLTPRSPARHAAALAEAALLLALCHENVLRCHDALPLLPDALLGAHALPRLCLVLELCDSDLARLIASGELADAPDAPGVILRHALGVTRGLRYLHARRVAHRDLKPANVLLRRGVVKLGDLGCAQDGSERGAGGAAAQRDADVGTRGYRAPEQLVQDGGARDAFRADRWALGVLLAELATGGSGGSGADGLEHSSRAQRGALAVAAGAACAPLATVVRGLLRRAPGRRMRLSAAEKLLSVERNDADEDSRSEGASSEDEDVRAADGAAPLLAHSTAHMR